MRVVIAPDSFKGSASASDVAAAIAEGWAETRPSDDVACVPMADGGEGTLDAIAAAIPAVRHYLLAPGPEDRPVHTSFLMLDADTAVVELAQTCGLQLTNRSRPMDTHTRGFGLSIVAALDAGAKRLLLAIGGSSATDGGTGMLRELGAHFLDSNGDELSDGGRGLIDLAHVDISQMRPRPHGGVQVLSDVDAPLYGPRGAAGVFSPQKGATPDQVRQLDSGLRRLGRHLALDPDTPGAGAAGGTGYALLAWGAELASGAERIAGIVHLSPQLASADYVITGEGRYDGQSRLGKVPAYVRSLASSLGKPTALVAGEVVADARDYDQTQDLTSIAGAAELSIADPMLYCRIAGSRLAQSALS